MEDNDVWENFLKDDILFGTTKSLDNQQSFLLVKKKFEVYFKELDKNLVDYRNGQSSSYLKLFPSRIYDIGVFGTYLISFLSDQCMEKKMFENEQLSHYLKLLNEYFYFLPKQLVQLRESLQEIYRQLVLDNQNNPPINEFSLELSLITSYQPVDLRKKIKEIINGSNPLDRFIEIVKLPKEKEENFKKLIVLLENSLEQTLGFLKPKLYSFGSLETGLASYKSDLDLVLWFEVINLDILDYETGMLILNVIRLVFQNQLSLNNDSLNIFLGRRCPIIKLSFDSYNEEVSIRNQLVKFIECDISVRNLYSFYNTKLIEFYCRYDNRFLQMTYLLKHWAKTFVGFKGGPNSVSCFSLMMLIVFFLEQTKPPVLPNVEHLQMIASLNRDMFPLIELNGNRFDFCSDTKMVGSSSNRQTPQELIYEFFVFYDRFNYNKAIIPRTGKTTDKFNLVRSKQSQTTDDHCIYFRLSFIVIEDPFVWHNNCGSGFDRNTFYSWTNSIRSMLTGSWKHPNGRKPMNSSNCVQDLLQASE